MSIQSNITKSLITSPDIPLTVLTGAHHNADLTNIKIKGECPICNKPVLSNQQRYRICNEEYAKIMYIHHLQFAETNLDKKFALMYVESQLEKVPINQRGYMHIKCNKP